jgi:hypothetical protein
MDLLEYLVPSRARRALLRALLVDGARGSVSALAREARLSFAGAHRELEAMRAAGLARSARRGSRVEYWGNPAHPGARALRALLVPVTARNPDPLASADDAVRAWLRAAGAPLGGRGPSGSPPPLEETLAAALTLAHRDATVARVLPLVLWLQRDQVDHAALARAATLRDERDALGMFLELAGRLAGDSSLQRKAARLRDRRRRRARPFFTRTTGPMAVATALRNTPPLARKWGYSLNLGLDSFASAFARHGGRSAA